MTELEATRLWVSEFNAIPTSVIEKLLTLDETSVEELTPNWEDYDSCLPVWGTVWTFDDMSDEDWAEKHIEEIAKCGFRIYENDDLGLFLGIDGGGYNFYRKHWIPLYELRGIKWHDEEDF